MAVSLRPAVADDASYILSSIRETLLKSSAYCTGLHPAAMASIIEPVLATYKTLVAVDSADQDSILGFILYEDPHTVAFIYVRSQFRLRGIARALLNAAEVQPGELTCALMVTKLGGKNFPRLAESKGYRVRFRPYIGNAITAQVGDMGR